MVMNYIRRRKKAQKIPMIILVVTLAIGLVGSFALWSLPQISQGANQKNLTPEEMAGALNKEIAKFEKELEKNPDDLETILALGQIKSQLGDIYLSQGKKEEAKDEYKDAFESFKVVTEKQPDNLSAQNGLAKVAVAIGEDEIAKKANEKALQIQETNQLNIIKNLQAQVDKEPDNLENITRLADTNFQLGYLYLQYGKEKNADVQFAKSLEIYQQIVAKNPDDADVMYRLAIAAYQVGNNDLADESFKKALQADENNPGKITSYGVFLMNTKKDFKAAIQQFDKALELDPDENLKNTLNAYKALAESQLDLTAENDEQQEDKADDHKTEENTAEEK